MTRRRELELLRANREWLQLKSEWNSGWQEADTSVRQMDLAGRALVMVLVACVAFVVWQQVKYDPVMKTFCREFAASADMVAATRTAAEKSGHSFDEASRQVLQNIYTKGVDTCD